MPLEILAAILVAIAVLVWIYRRDRRRFEVERAMLFDDVRGLLGDAEIIRAPGEYPKLRGKYRGHDIAIDAVVDHIAVRKLPSLWLRVTALAPIPFAGTCDILARAHNVEFFSPSIDLNHGVLRPAHWPDHLTIKTDDPATMPPQALLDAHIGAFGDERMKELLITSRGVRLVRQVAQGSRAEYMVLRQALFGPVVVERSLLAGMLDAVIGLADDLRKGAAAAPAKDAADHE
ncbi:MAG TPA: hypothetical protein VGM59_12245 [Dongiaceae bacterium]